MDKDKKRDAVASYKARKITGGVYCIKNTVTGRIYVQWATDLHGCENRFKFAQTTGSCIHHCLAADWNEYGGKSFSFELLETIDKNEEQTSAEFQEDVTVLFDMWHERLVDTPQY